MINMHPETVEAISIVLEGLKISSLRDVLWDSDDSWQWVTFCDPLSALHRVANATSLSQMADSVDDEQYAKLLTVLDSNFLS